MTNQELHGLNQTWIKWPSTFGSQSSNALLDYTQRNQKTNLSTGHVWSNFNPKGLVRQSSLFLGREVLPKCCNLSTCSRPRKRQEKTSDIVLTYIYIYIYTIGKPVCALLQISQLRALSSRSFSKDSRSRRNINFRASHLSCSCQSSRTTGLGAHGRQNPGSHDAWRSKTVRNPSRCRSLTLSRLSASWQVRLDIAISTWIWINILYCANDANMKRQGNEWNVSDSIIDNTFIGFHRNS